MTITRSPLIAAAKATPLLTQERERALFDAYRSKGDHRARNSIAIAHLRLVIGEVQRFASYRLPADELITEGNIAVMQAIESFDPDRGVRFCAYARHWVRSAIMAYVLKSRSLVAISGTKADKRLFFQLDRARAALAAAHGGTLPERANALIASSLKVTEAAVEQMSSRLSGDQSCDAPMAGDDDSTLLDTIASPESDPETLLTRHEERSEAVLALTILSEREREILKARIYTDADTVPELSELAATYGVTPQRIHQIEKAALRKLREAMLARAS